MNNQKQFTYDRIGDIVCASGVGWDYQQIGDLSCFTQESRVPSLRVVKTLVKRMNKLTEEK